ncbi:unnamed protein product, partial [Brassica oleracea]
DSADNVCYSKDITESTKNIPAHFTITIDGILQLFEAVANFDSSQVEASAERGLDSILMSTPPFELHKYLIIQARNEGRDLAVEGNEIIREACKWSPELAAACEVWKEITFNFSTIDKLDVQD